MAIMNRGIDERNTWLVRVVYGLLIGLMAMAGQVMAEVKFSISDIHIIGKSKTAIEGEKLNYVKPSWSPDAKMLAFETLIDKQRQLYVYSEAEGKSYEIESSKSKTAQQTSSSDISRPSRAVANFDLTWARRRGSGLFAYVGSGPQGYFGLYYMSPQYGWNDFWLIVGGDPGDPYVAFPDYHPQYDYLLYCRGEKTEFEENARLELYGIESSPKAKGEKTKGQRLSDRQDLPQLEPSFSPRGNEIAFTGIDQGNNDIYKASITVEGKADGTWISQGEIVRLTEFPTPEGRASWSPDGSVIAFLSGQGENKNEWGLWLMNADGSNKRKLASRVLDEDLPEWHPDGEHLFFVRVFEEQQNPIQYINIRTKELETLETDTALHTHLDISADGSKIAFCAKGQSKDKNLTWSKLYVASLQKR